MTDTFEITGQNHAALFTLKVYRGDGMAMQVMNWKAHTPPDNFVGFAVEYKAWWRQVFRAQEPAELSQGRWKCRS